MNFICFGHRPEKKNTEWQQTEITGQRRLVQTHFFGYIDAHFCANKIKAPPYHHYPNDDEEPTK